MGAVLATVLSKGSTNQSVFGFEEMVSTFLLSMFQVRGAFCQVSGPGRTGMDGVFCAKASAEARHRRNAEMQIIFGAREFMLSPHVKMAGHDCLGLYRARNALPSGLSSPSLQNAVERREQRNATWASGMPRAPRHPARLPGAG